MKDPEKVIQIKVINNKDNSLVNHWLTEEEFELLKKAVAYLKDVDLDYLFSIKRIN
jgi:hypothetical protein